MKVVILAGGFGTRLQEETVVKPKPMVEIGQRPILWHIMKHYAYYGFNEFIIALGYLGEVIKRYFLDYYVLNTSISVDLSNGDFTVHEKQGENWMVHLIDTGFNTLTGGRVKNLEPWLKDGTFMLTYGDGVSNVDLKALLHFHKSHGKLATMTAVRPPARFGGIIFENNLATSFTEKPQIGEGWINGGFLVFEPGIFDYIADEQSSLESDVMERLVDDGQLAIYQHDDFWQCMDTLRDKHLLERLWQKTPPWRVWE